MRTFVWALCALLLGDVAHAAPSAPLSVSLPDVGTYSVWVQAKTGTVSVLPKTVTHKKTVPLLGAHTGDTVFVLDAHTGNVAARPLSANTPLTLAVSDFRPVAQDASSATKAVPVAPEKAPSAPNTGEAGTNKAGGIGQFVSWLLGLALAAAVVWFLWRMVQTRGEPLVALARKVGIDVPDPKALDPNASVMPVYQPPKPRTVETVPDDAGLPPNIAPSSAVPPLLGAGGASRAALAAVPQLVGLAGLAAGATFTLADGDTVIGRDGNSDIVLAEDSVSRRHALLTRDTADAVRLTDTGSANGVLVNGRRVQEALLVPGDEIRLGDNTFRYEGPSA